MKRLFALSLVAVLGAGCAAPLEVGSITNITPNTGSSTTDVYQPRRLAGDTSVPAFAGDQLVEVRTYHYVDGHGQKEMAGAQCKLSAGTFSAEMTTPAKVRVPLYRSSSESLAVQCGREGYKTRMVTLKPFDRTRKERYSRFSSAGGAGGLIGVVVATAAAGIADAAADNTQNEWNYPPARITLDQLPDADDKS